MDVVVVVEHVGSCGVREALGPGAGLGAGLVDVVRVAVVHGRPHPVVEAVQEEMAGLVEDGVLGVGGFAVQVDGVGPGDVLGGGVAVSDVDIKPGAGAVVGLSGDPAVAHWVLALAPQVVDGVECVPAPAREARGDDRGKGVVASADVGQGL
ncbi:hypothetical protein [Streptomyces sp. C3-3]|uniref:hypothetical protein n=1 Tax=Streptomyces sp. C3-3 TaxID=2824901 RepID=UPI001B36C371|nr:hypothetical protein [Streptomyces sp. C3-3]MBQ1116227.1 hypothetical protein [Streptomyces sp. C3-3]